MLNYEITGMGACLADGAKIRVTAMLSENIEELLPYINAVVKYASYDTERRTITFKYRELPVVLESRRVVIGQLDDLDKAEDVLDDLKDFLNRLKTRKEDITPSFNSKPLPQHLEIIKLLPMGNCSRTDRYCKFVRDKAMCVNHLGYVSPCYALMHSYNCYVYGRQKEIIPYYLGNVNEKSLAEIWKEAEYVNFRLTVKDFKFPSCSDCRDLEGCSMATITRWIAGATVPPAQNAFGPGGSLPALNQSLT